MPSSLARSLIVLIAIASAAFANSNRKVSWKTYETAHFEILFHDDIAAQAGVARVFLEQAYAKITADLGMRERGIVITVVLTGVPDESNGFATPLGHRMVIYTRPMQVLAAPEIAWLKRVLAHELTHQITFLTLRKSFWGIYSELYKSAALPAWFMEGLAQYEAESWDAKRNTFFAHALYNSALEPYPDLATYTKWDPVTGRLVYEQGHAFIRFLAARQGPGFIAKLLARIRVIPVWNEIKSLLSPLTASRLALEDALRDKTGAGIRALYREFLDSSRAGLPAALPGVKPLGGGVPGFAMVFQAKRIDSTAFLFTAQKAWDQPTVALYESRQGKVDRIGPGNVNPVFDLSPSGKRIAYVQTSTDIDGEPRENLYVAWLGRGERMMLSDGAAHPAFLSDDSIAFSHYAHGRQALAICALGHGKPACREEAPDSLVGFYALSRSARGLLLNATDSAGRTGIYEYAPGSGFVPVFRDAVPGEFPVEAAGGSVLMLRDRGGLWQVDALDRPSGRVAPAATFPLGTFYLHRAAPGTAASVAQVGKPGGWGLQPVAIAPPAPEAFGPAPDTGAARIDSAGVAPSVAAQPADTAGGLARPMDSAKADAGAPAGDTLAAKSDTLTAKPDSGSQQARAAAAETVAVYRKPGFLETPLPDFPARRKPRDAAAKPYYSLLGMRPLIATPFLASTFTDVALGATCFLQDPLELHTLTVSGGVAGNGGVYAVDYLNQETPAHIDLYATNGVLEVDELDLPAGWKYLYLVTRSTALSAGLSLPFPVPADVWALAGFRAAWYFREHTLAGENGDEPFGEVEGWSKRRVEEVRQAFLGLGYMSPYAYALIHPLLEFDAEAGAAFKDYGTDVFYYGRGTVPLGGEWTFTARWEGEFLAYDAHAYEATLPDGSPETFFWGGSSGQAMDGYAGVDFPVYKGYIGELPILGLWNYLGAGVFGSFYRREYDEQVVDNRYRFLAHAREEVVAGAKLSALFHVMRRTPLALSVLVGYDPDRDSPVVRVRTELSGIPSSVSLRPSFDPGLGEARKRGP